MFFAAIPYLRGRFSQCAIYQFITSAYSTNLMLPHTDNLIDRAGLEAKEVLQIKRLCTCLALPKKCSRIKPCPLPSTGTDCICWASAVLPVGQHACVHTSSLSDERTAAGACDLQTLAFASTVPAQYHGRAPCLFCLSYPLAQLGTSI